MKSLVILIGALSIALATPPYPVNNQRYYNAQLLRSESVNNEDGNYRYSYALSDGTMNQQTGYLKYPAGKRIQAVEGSYSYISPEGIPIKMSYRADEGGFQAFYDNVPQSPPIPPAIQESLALQWKNAQEQLSRSGSTISADTFFPQLNGGRPRTVPAKRASHHHHHHSSNSISNPSDIPTFSYYSFDQNNNNHQLPNFPVLEVNTDSEKINRELNQLPLIFTPASSSSTSSSSTENAEQDYPKIQMNPNRKYVRRTVVRR